MCRIFNAVLMIQFYALHTSTLNSARQSLRDFGVMDSPSEKEWLACCGSAKFAQEMASAAPFSNYQQAVDAARDIWFNKVDVNGWLEAFAAHPAIGETPSKTVKSQTSAQWSKGEQSTALATATDATLQELYDWNARYRQKFGFVFLIFASGRSTPEILAEIKQRYHNRPIIEFELSAKEQMKITELRISKLFPANATVASITKTPHNADVVTKAGDRISVIGGHLSTAKETPAAEPPRAFTRTRPPITTHILDIARGAPASGVDVRLEIWADKQSRPLFGKADSGLWKLEGVSSTDRDGRSGQLISMVDALSPGIYRISFDTGKYNPEGFFPYVGIVFEVKEYQKWEHFHVPLLLSPFSFSTYRGS
ncbi:uric acid degradation bifunctional protein TTL-like isoform X1 [Salvia splendens]|uniref:uric acid degradation bifunctional protein TTL-like isoform X1 n=1 Tax=Salvia splendens TaxID=180675 RepID=UPI001C2692B1|nr:uric acid degradation bifunctional protein TTL-like isoform X1 [Salvia splendens]